MEILLLVFIISIMAWAVFKPKNTSYIPPQSNAADPSIFTHYEARESLFVNRSELAFFHSLSRALPQGYFVLTKPRLEDVIGVKKNLTDKKLVFSLRGRVKSRHVDFVVINDEGRPLMGIELDGSSHNNRAAKAGDDLKDGIFAAAGVALLRVKPGEDFAAISQKISHQLSQ